LRGMLQKKFSCSFAWSLVLALFVVGVGHAQTLTVDFDFDPGANIDIVAGSGLRRQSSTVKGVLTIESTHGPDVGLEAKVRTEPGDGWWNVDMNTAHDLIMSIDDWHLGFDIAITESGVLPVTDDCSALGHWCVGGVPMLMQSLGPAALPGQWEDSFDVHVRLVLVDEFLPDAHTAGFNLVDNLRFISLPAGGSRVVNVDIIVTEQ